MITKLRLVNYRTHRDTTIDLEPLTVFIGPVASGKSNVFNGLSQLAALVRREPSDAFGPEGPFSFESVRLRGAAGDGPIGFEVCIGPPDGDVGLPVHYSLSLSQEPGGHYAVREERVRQMDSDDEGVWRSAIGRVTGPLSWLGTIAPTDPPLIHEAFRGYIDGCWDEYMDNLASEAPAGATRPQRPSELALLDRLSRALVSQRLHRLTPEAVASPSPESGARVLDLQGAGLAAVVAELKAKVGLRAKYEALLSTVARFEPRAKDVVVAPVPGDKLTWGLRFDDGSTYWAPELSDGTLLAVGLAAMAAIVPPDSRVCIEEPETGVHPRLLRDILDIFVELAYPTNGAEPIQVLLSTHSPYLLDFFKDMPECVRVFDLVDGESQVRTLHQALEERRTPLDEFGDLALGEAWHAGLIGGVERCP